MTETGLSFLCDMAQLQIPASLIILPGSGSGVSIQFFLRQIKPKVSCIVATRGKNAPAGEV